ncbi:MAG: Rha family transcriptional regulator [Pseudomonas sp.]|jgi:phage regulator Rha-like protein|uniref:Rha family transcriptional regulator n=1 Tax=Pseudomonas sp. TaxID=306 RepID=UPI003D12FE3B
MNALTALNTSATLTMSSREIAELLGCRHDSVKRTIDTLADKGLVTFTQTVEKGRGRPVTLYHVGKRDSYVIVAQLSPDFTAKLVDRWQELEAQVAATPKVPQTFAEALRLAAELEEQRAYLA